MIFGCPGTGFMKNRKHTINLLCQLVIAITIYTPSSHGQDSREILVFPQATSINRTSLDGNSTLDNHDYDVGIDFFATFEIDNFRFLGEFLLSNNEQHFERFQLGWVSNNHIFWLGRFHNPTGYWNTDYHHGSYLQTSISRPSIVEFEHEGGVLPVHQAGLLVEGTFNQGEKGFGYSLAVAQGPEFTHGLEAWEVLDPGDGNMDTSATFNLYRDFDLSTTSRLGLFLNYTKIPASSIDVKEIEQTSYGIYARWGFDRWQLHGSSHFVENSFGQSTGSPDHTFFNAYLQGEYQLNDSWTLYGRLEETSGQNGDAYLALFPHFVEDRVLGGVRYDFARQVALKFELSTNQTQTDDFDRIMLQLSAMF